MGRKLMDLTGQIYNKLTVLYEVERDKNNNRMWHCQCDCGNICIVPTRYLRTGEKTSCGECKKDGPGKNVIDLTGQIFGKLKVLKYVDSDERGEARWECECNCLDHNHVIVLGSNLRTGHTQSCGCIKRSVGEFQIEHLLKENNIFYNKEKIFDDCRNVDTNRPLRFDFYINNQYLIEYDGEQHFIKSRWNEERDFLEKRRERDEIKNKYCKEHNIPLIRIPYTHLNELCLEDLLLETSQFIIT